MILIAAYYWFYASMHYHLYCTRFYPHHHKSYAYHVYQSERYLNVSKALLAASNAKFSRWLGQ